jgi:hypothetical protein
LGNRIENVTPRNEKGQFLPGMSFGLEGPPKKYERLKQALINAATPQDIEDIMHKMIALAKMGSVPAATLVINRLFSNPKSAVTVETHKTELSISAYANLTVEDLQLMVDRVRRGHERVIRLEAHEKGELAQVAGDADNQDCQPRWELTTRTTSPGGRAAGAFHFMAAAVGNCCLPPVARCRERTTVS